MITYIKHKGQNVRVKSDIKPNNEQLKAIKELIKVAYETKV